MNVTPSGAVLIAYGVWLLLASRRGRLLQAIMFFGSFSATAVINFSNYGLGPALFFLLLLLLSKLLSGEAFRAVRISRDHLLLIPLLGLFAVISVTSLLVNGGLHGLVSIEVTQTAYILSGILATVVLTLEMTRPERLEDAVRALRAGGTFIAAWGIVQAACFYAGIDYPAILFNNSSSHFADMFDQHADAGLIRIASVTTEPSYLASSLLIFATFGATLLAVEPRFRTPSWFVPVGLAVLVIAASTSSTGYFGLLVLAFLLGLRRPGLMLCVGAAAAAVATVALSLLPSFAAAVYGATFGKGTSGSYADRSQWTWHAIYLFLEQPWLGWGWGSNFSYSIVSALLASVGIIGTGSFAGVLAGTLMSSQAARRSLVSAEQWRLRAYASAAENALLVYTAVSVISGFRFTVLDFWALWALVIAIPSCMVCSARDQPAGERRRGQPHRGRSPAVI